MKKGLFKFLVTILIAVISISAVPISIYAADSDFEIVLNVGGKTGYIRKYLAKLMTLKDNQLELADFDKNSKVNVKDATAIQKEIANII